MVKEIYSDFLDMLFPVCCQACGCALVKHEKLLCTHCIAHLPIAGKLDYEILQKKFWGKIAVKHALAYLYFTKKGQVQKIIHALKYKGVKEIGLLLGKWFAAELERNGFSDQFDIVLPVPLHISKLRKRGYNQSEGLAQGLATGLQIPFNATALVREIPNISQTSKSRMARWENVKEVFALKDPDAVRGKRVLLVDDVITSGATLEAAALPILKLGEPTSLSIAALAMAR